MMSDQEIITTWVKQADGITRPVAYILLEKYYHLQTLLAYAEDAAQKGRLARENAGGMELQIAELTERLAKYEKVLA